MSKWKNFKGTVKLAKSAWPNSSDDNFAYYIAYTFNRIKETVKYKSNDKYRTHTFELNPSDIKMLIPDYPYSRTELVFTCNNYTVTNIDLLHYK